MSLNLLEITKQTKSTHPIAKLVSTTLGIFLIAACYATGISTQPIATYNNFLSTNQTAPSSFTIYGGTATFLPGAISAFFTPHSAISNGLLVLRNVNHVDFSKSGGTAIHLANPTSSSERISFELHDNLDRAVGINIVLPPNSSMDYALVNQLTTDGAAEGMEFLPQPYIGIKNILCQGNPNFDWSQVSDVQIYVMGPFSVDAVVNVSNIRLLQPYTMTELMTADCDSLGQTTLMTPENYIASPSDLVTELQTQEAELASGPLLTQLDQYGGTLGLPAQTATGHFRLQQISGKWWMVTPLGHLFFASGIDQIDPTLGQTVVTNRQYMFTSLPSSSSALADNYSTIQQGGQTVATYNLYTSNLQQKFNTPNWQTSWFNMAKSRIVNWGFNSLGSYCGTYGYANGTLPYIADVSERGNYDTVNTGNTLWGGVPDPFDPRFQIDLVSNINSDDRIIKNDPYCYGMFAGIEMSWTGAPGPLQNYGVAVGSLAASPSSPAKMAFQTSLITEYGNDITKLNSSWGTSYVSWQDFLNKTSLPSVYTSGFLSDMNSFTFTFIHRYFTVVHGVIKQFNPNLLDLGTEISTNHYSPLVIAAASGIVDSMCMNNVEATPDPQILADAKQYNMPVLITEFHFESPDSGMFGGTVALEPSEAARDSATSTYLQAALTNPMVIGANWYRYTDDPILGDIFGVNGGDNLNVGIIDITDCPYYPLVNAFEQVHLNMYSTRWNY